MLVLQFLGALPALVPGWVCQVGTVTPRGLEVLGPSLASLRPRIVPQLSGHQVAPNRSPASALFAQFILLTSRDKIP